MLFFREVLVPLLVFGFPKHPRGELLTQNVQTVHCLDPLPPNCNKDQNAFPGMHSKGDFILVDFFHCLYLFIFDK